MFLLRRWLLLLVHLGFISCTLQCSVCVIEPLLTSPVKCPICNNTDANTLIEKKDESGLSSPYGDAKINWTTCFVEAQPCNASSKYRTIDGSCNNLKDPMRGMTQTAFIRLLPAHYQDNKHSLALGSDGQPKPSSRKLRTTFFTDKNNPDDVTLMLMQWGQIVAHDFVQTVLSAPANDCCSQPGSEDKHKCLPIKVPSDDYFYSQFNVTCISEKRNDVTLIGDCNENQPGQQYNNVTHPMDASLVYGSNLERSHRIREFQGGRLRIQQVQGCRAFLPNLPQEHKAKQCFIQTPDKPCYDSGDTRVVQNPQLAVLQTVLLREHNTIADKLQELHPEWDDETVYQETRAILTAMIQHITYNEWLDLHIGKLDMIKFKLYPRVSGYTEYNGDVHLATINSFAAAALRVVHSGIQGFLSMINYKGQIQRKIPIGDWLHGPAIIQQSSNYDQFLLGLVNQPMQVFEQHFTEQMSNMLFHNQKPYGNDLISLDIERGRDHGLAPYIHYLEVCTGYHVTKFEDLYRYIPIKHVLKLGRYYKSVEDIDLMIGGTLEYMIPGTRLGPTFRCLFTEQFYRLKWGDRFWYEVKEQPHSFTRSQLKEIRKISLSRLICDNSDNITQIAPNSFLPPSVFNRIVPCSTLPGINLNEWK